MAVSRKEGIQHEIVLSAAWGLIVLSATGLPTSLMIQMPTDLLAIQRPTSPVSSLAADRIPVGADRIPVGADRLFWRASAATCEPHRPIG